MPFADHDFGALLDSVLEQSHVAEATAGDSRGIQKTECRIIHLKSVLRDHIIAPLYNHYPLLSI